MRMRMRTTGIVLGAAVLAVAACQRDQAAEAPADGAAGDRGAAAAPASEQLAPPRLRAGLWQVSTAMEGVGAPMTSRMCLDDAVQAEMAVFGQSDPRCRQTRLERDAAGGWNFASVCEMGAAGTMTAEGVATGDFQSRYETRMTTTTSGAELAQMNRSYSVTSVSTFEGPCPDGWRPGDIETPVGRMNIADIQREAGSRGQ